MNNKRLTFLTVFLLFCLTSNAQDATKKDYPLKADVETLDGIIKAYYDVISGPAGQPRNWERDKSLHHPNALISVTGKDKNNKPFIIVQSLPEYHKSFGVPKIGFWEYEIKRENTTIREYNPCLDYLRNNRRKKWSSYRTWHKQHSII